VEIAFDSWPTALTPTPMAVNGTAIEAPVASGQLLPAAVLRPQSHAFVISLL
jgi:hypothetical protein